MTAELQAACDELADVVTTVIGATDDHYTDQQAIIGDGEIHAAALAQLIDADDDRVRVELTMCAASVASLIGFDTLAQRLRTSLFWFAGKRWPGLGVFEDFAEPETEPTASLLDDETAWLSSASLHTVLTFTPET